MTVRKKSFYHLEPMLFVPYAIALRAADVENIATGLLTLFENKCDGIHNILDSAKVSQLSPADSQLPSYPWRLEEGRETTGLRHHEGSAHVKPVSSAWPGVDRRE